MLGRGRAAADRGRRRHHQRRRRRPARRARRADRRAGRPDADGLGHHPRRPPADGRHGRAADLPPYGNATDARLRLRARHRQPVGQPAHRRARHLPRAAARSSTSTSSRPRSAASSPPTTASSPTPAPRWSCSSRSPGSAQAARLPDYGVWVEDAQAQAHDAAPDPLRRRADQAAAGVRGDEPGVRPRHPLRQHDRPVPDRRRPVPARLQARGTGSTPARPARWAGRCRPRSASAPPTRTPPSSRSPATTTSSS